MESASDSDCDLCVNEVKWQIFKKQIAEQH